MTYHTDFFQNPNDFLARTLTDLAKDETRNNLLLGLALRLKENLHAYGEGYRFCRKKCRNGGDDAAFPNDCQQ